MSTAAKISKRPRLPSPSPPPSDFTPDCIADLRRLAKFLKNLGQDYKTIRASPNGTLLVSKLYAWVKERVDDEDRVDGKCRMGVDKYGTWFNDNVDDLDDPTLYLLNWRLLSDGDYDAGRAHKANLEISADIGGVFTVHCEIVIHMTYMHTKLRLSTKDFSIYNGEEYKLENFSWTRVHISNRPGSGDEVTLRTDYESARASVMLMGETLSRVGAVVNVHDILCSLMDLASSDEDEDESDD
jgi:hypothetical protein